MDKCFQDQIAKNRVDVVPHNWRNPASYGEMMIALDTGELYIAMGNGRYWLLRRNGATQRWKRDPSRFRTPVKFGFRGCAALTEHFPLHALRIAE